MGARIWRARARYASRRRDTPRAFASGVRTRVHMTHLEENIALWYVHTSQHHMFSGGGSAGASSSGAPLAAASPAAAGRAPPHTAHCLLP